MTIKSFFARSAAAAALIAATPAVLPAAWNPVTAAQASVSVSINFNTFYRDLGDDGDWLYFRGRYVWVPGGRPYGWRPYMYGHWVWTRPYGWMWVSDEPFGWATYHYGRWGYSYAIGWYWVPGTRWAPAWVTWANDDDNIIWAPLPPGADDFDTGFAYADFPDYYWNCVPARRFLDDDISVAVIIDLGARRRIFADVRPVGSVRFRNDLAINAAIDLNFVEKRSKRKVRVFEVESTSNPGRAIEKDGRLAVFNGKVAGGGDAKPARLRDLGDVEQAHAKRKDRITADQKLPEVLGRPAKGKTESLQGNGEGQGQSLKLDKKRRKATDGGNLQPGDINGESQDSGNSQALTKKQKRELRRKQLQEQSQPEDLTGGGQLPADQGQQQFQPNKKKRKLQQFDQQQLDGGQSPADEGQQQLQSNKKKRQWQQQQNEQGGEMTMPGGEQPGAGNGKLRHKKDRGGNNGACDPSVDPNCIVEPQ